MIIFTAAYGHNNAIGFKGRVPWPRMQADRDRLHSLTEGKTVVLGERTYREFQDVRRTLRTTHIIVVSRNVTKLPDAEVVSSLEPIIERSKTEDMWVNGGGSLFSQLLPYASKMYLTEIDVEAKADTYFPEFSLEEWQLESQDPHTADSQNPFAYNFKVFTRKLR